MLDKMKKIEDKGWQDMRIILDREMPQDKKKRRFFWWYYAAGFGLVITSCILYFNKNNSSNFLIKNEFVSNNVALNTESQIANSLPSNKLENKIISESNQKNTHVQKLTTAERPISQINLKNNYFNTAEILETSTLPSSEPIGQNTNKHIASDISLLENKAYIPGKAIIQNSVSIENNIVEKSFEKKLSEINSSTTNEAPIHKNEWVEISQLKRINPNLISTNFSNTFHLKNIEYVKYEKAINKFDLNVGLGVRTLFPLKSPMLYAGLGISYNINKRWSLNTGVFCAMSISKKDTLQVASNYLNQYSDSQINTGATSYIQDLSVFNQNLIHLPLSVGYKINNIINIRGGLYYDKFISKQLYSSTGSPKTILETKNADKELAVLDQKYFSHNFNWLAGIDIAASTKLSFSIEALGNRKLTSEIKNLSKNNNPCKVLPNLQMSVKYNIGKY